MTIQDKTSDPAPAAEDEIHPEAVELAAVIALVFALALLVLVPFATSPAPEGRAWFLSPRKLPLLGLLMMLSGAAFLTLDFLRRRTAALDRQAFWQRAMTAFDGMREACLYTLVFCLYVAALTYIGFALSTLIFGQVCLWIAGLRERRWVAWNFGFTIIVVVMLRVVMGLWFPQAPILEFAPGWFANSIGTYL
jgi:hypothetical protein